MIYRATLALGTLEAPSVRMPPRGPREPFNQGFRALGLLGFRGLGV